MSLIAVPDRRILAKKCAMYARIEARVKGETWQLSLATKKRKRGKKSCQVVINCPLLHVIGEERAMKCCTSDAAIK